MYCLADIQRRNPKNCEGGLFQLLQGRNRRGDRCDRGRT